MSVDLGTVLVGIVSAALTALPLLYAQHLRHKEAMRKLDMEERKRAADATQRAKALEDHAEERRQEHARQMAGIARRQELLERRSTQLVEHLQTNTFELRQLQQLARNSHFGSIQGK